jgi:putative aldouronate transport system permease protein
MYKDLKMNGGIYLLALPVIAYFLVFHYLPMFGLIIAFEDFNAVKGIFQSPWVGFANFIEFFKGPSFFTILRNTLVISLLGLGVGFPLSIVFALLLNEIQWTGFKRVVQTISYLPYFVSTVVIAGLVIEFVSSHGMITNMLAALGFPRENLLTNPKYFWGINLISDVWQGLGYGSIIFIASISSTRAELHEAAAIDGAGRLQRAWHITIPAMMPTIVTVLILRVGLLMNVGFDKILLLYNPSIYETADVIATHVQRMGINRMQYGYSAAVGFFNSLVGTLLLLLSNYVSKKYTEHSIL